MVHPLHMSFTRIDMQANGRVQLTIKLFTDDFDRAVQQHLGANPLFRETPVPEAETLAQRYIQAHFEITANNKVLPLKYLRYTQNFEATWFYFETKVPKTGTPLGIDNRLMTDFFRDQKNLVIVDYQGVQTPVQLDNAETHFVWQP